MKQIKWKFITLILSMLMILFSSTTWSSEAHFIEIRGTVNPATSRYLARAIKEAEVAKGDFLLIELDTPGGLVSSVREMAQNIDQSKIPVSVFTTPAGSSATSAGALLMISSHLAAMAPGTNIGAAHPVSAQGEDIKGVMGEKAVNDISAFARSMAELRKRNVKAASEVVSKSNSFTAEEARKSGLIEVIATDRNDLWENRCSIFCLTPILLLFGTILVALATSLPELVSTLAAFRMGAPDLALGNIFGSNAFNMILFMPLDIMYPKVLFSSVRSIHAVTAMSVVAATG